ncbi:MAG: hypothetical protein M1817_006913 [Caeruleum heppii]|nr:MAG: hypothetical protein M1817_006913 [Caeruleum heppii]
MSSDPFAYRAPLTDADLDLEEDCRWANNALSVKLGWITEEEAERRRRGREALRETKKKVDRHLKDYVNAMFSSDDSDFDGEKPLTPPRSPKPMPGSIEYDLSENAWMRECELMRLRGRHDPKDWGFEDYGTWKQYQIKHNPHLSVLLEAGPAESSNPLCQPLTAHPPASKVESAKDVGVRRSPRPASKVKSRWNTRAGQTVPRRATRLQTRTTPTLFYELGSDGTTPREISLPSRNHRRPNAHKAIRSPNRVQKPS